MVDNGTKRRSRSSTFGTTRRLPSGRWQASYHHEGRRYWSTFDSKADADAWLAMARSEIGRGQWLDPAAGGERFASYATGWLESRPALRPRTRELYASELRRHLIPAFGRLPLRSITTARVRAWHGELAREMPITAAKCYRLLRVILQTAVEDRLLASNPCVIKNAGRERSPERRVPSLSQIEQVASALSDRYRALVYTAAFAGLRLGECAALTRERVDLERRTITVSEQAQQVVGEGRVIGDPKSQAGKRVVAIPTALVQILEHHLADYVAPGPAALVFTADKGGPLLGQHFSRRFARARSAVGMDWLHFHDLRHFAGTAAAQTGATTRELMVRLGHSTPRAALIYQHATEERDHAIADGLDALILAAEAQRAMGAVVHGECTPAASNPEQVTESGPDLLV